MLRSVGGAASRSETDRLLKTTVHDDFVCRFTRRECQLTDLVAVPNVAGTVQVTSVLGAPTYAWRSRLYTAAQCNRNFQFARAPPAAPQLAPSADRLHAAADLFDPFPRTLSERKPATPRRAWVERSRVVCYGTMRPRAELPKRGHEVASVAALRRRDGHALGGRFPIKLIANFANATVSSSVSYRRVSSPVVFGIAHAARAVSTHNAKTELAVLGALTRRCAGCRVCPSATLRLDRCDSLRASGFKA